MDEDELKKLVLDIVNESILLKDTYTNTPSAIIEFCDIFSSDSNEYNALIKTIERLGKAVFPGPTGDIYLLKEPLNTAAGNLYYIKIRKPDDKLRLRGDADFNTNYRKLLSKHKDDPWFEHIIRDKFEMLRLSDPKFNVMTCFSNIPVREWI